MTNTINNVSRDLLDSLLTVIESNGYAADEVEVVDELRALLSAPSPAGVDGLEVVGYSYGNGILINDTTQPDNPMYTKLVRLSDAQAIIDGLRGEVAKISSDRAACWAEFKVMTRACLDAEKERDQLAGLLRESEKTISQLQAERPTSRRIARYLDAMRAKINAALSELPK